MDGIWLPAGRFSFEVKTSCWSCCRIILLPRCNSIAVYFSVSEVSRPRSILDWRRRRLRSMEASASVRMRTLVRGTRSNASWRFLVHAYWIYRCPIGYNPLASTIHYVPIIHVFPLVGKSCPLYYADRRKGSCKIRKPVLITRKTFSLPVKMDTFCYHR